MDERALPVPVDCRLAVQAAGADCSWRLTTPQGACLGGVAPDFAAARRSAAFVALAVAALGRTQQRRF